MQTPNDPNQSQYAGTSNPPGPDGQVQISNPDSTSGNTPSLTAPQPTPPANAQAPQTPQAQGPQGQPTQQQIAQIQSDAQGQNGNQQAPKSPDLSKAPAGSQAPVGSMPQQAPPQVQRASLMNNVAQALAGGPRFSYTYSADGTLQKTQIPVSNAHLGMAIALEALQGAATGFAHGQGPAGKANAVGASFAGGQQQAQQQNNQNKQQAQQDYAQKAQTAETNMRLYMNARAVGKMNEADNEAYVAQSKDVADMVQKQFPGYVEATNVDYKGLSKYNMTQYTAIPYKVVPRLDADGKRVEINGVPQSDINYMVLKPDFKSKVWVDPKQQAKLAKYGVVGMTNPGIQDATFQARMNANLLSQATAADTGEKIFNSIFDTTDEAVSKSNGTTTSPVDATQPGALTKPEIKDPTLAGLVNTSANNYADMVKGIVSPDAFHALMNGIISQESGGKLRPSDATGDKGGPAQLTEATAKDLGVKDRTDPGQSVDGGTKRFANMLQQFKDPKLAMAAYYSGPGAIKNGQIVATPQHTVEDTQKYVDQVSARVGLNQTTQIAPTASDHPDPEAYAQDHPGFLDAMTKFVGAYNGLPPGKEGQIGAALEHMQSTDPNAAALIGNFLTQKGEDTIKTHDDYVTTQAEQRKQDVLTAAAEEKAKNKNSLDQVNSQKMADMVRGPQGFDFGADPSLKNLGMNQLEQALKDKGVTIPLNFSDLYNIAKYKDDPNNYATRVWAKGSPDEMDKGTAMTYIHNFINPDFDQKTYSNMSTTGKRLYNPDSQINKNITAISTATNHMDLLQQASAAYSRSDLPTLNKLAGQLDVATGGDKYAVLSALVNKVNTEVSNVTAGGFAPHAEDVAQMMKNMTPSNTNDQINALVKTYTGLMAGRLEPVNNEIKQLTGEDLKVIDPNVSKLFQRYGYQTPWDHTANQNNNNQNANQNQPQPNFTYTTSDGKQGWNGSAWVPTGK